VTKGSTIDCRSASGTKHYTASYPRRPCANQRLLFTLRLSSLEHGGQSGVAHGRHGVTAMACLRWAIRPTPDPNFDPTWLYKARVATNSIGLFLLWIASWWLLYTGRKSSRAAFEHQREIALPPRHYSAQLCHGHNPRAHPFFPNRLPRPNWWSDGDLWRWLAFFSAMPAVVWVSFSVNGLGVRVRLYTQTNRPGDEQRAQQSRLARRSPGFWWSCWDRVGRRTVERTHMSVTQDGNDGGAQMVLLCVGPSWHKAREHGVGELSHWPRRTTCRRRMAQPGWCSGVARWAGQIQPTPSFLPFFYLFIFCFIFLFLSFLI
jgi:hypothetical protein